MARAHNHRHVAVEARHAADVILTASGNHHVRVQRRDASDPDCIMPGPQ